MGCSALLDRLFPVHGDVRRTIHHPVHYTLVLCVNGARRVKLLSFIARPMALGIGLEPDAIFAGGSATVLQSLASDGGMKPEDVNVVLLKIEDKGKYEDAITYLYAGTDPAAVHKPITIYKEKGSNAYLVAGRYTGVTETHLKYKPLNAEEQKIVAEKLGSGKIIRFLSSENTQPQ